jgi:hypothetical protein
MVAVILRLLLQGEKPNKVNQGLLDLMSKTKEKITKNCASLAAVHPQVIFYDAQRHPQVIRAIYISAVGPGSRSPADNSF